MNYLDFGISLVLFFGEILLLRVHHQYFLNRIAGSQQAFHQPVKGFSRFVGWNDHIYGFLTHDHCTPVAQTISSLMF